MGLDKWTTTKPHPTEALSYHAVAYGNAAGNDQFVAVGPVSIVRSQDEGASWINDTIITVPVGGDAAKLTKSYSSVAYGDGVFVAVGSYKFRWDGMNWSEQLSQTVGGATKWLRAIAYGTVGVGGPNAPKRFGLFVAVGDAGTIVTTRDGVTWATNNSGTTDTFRAIAYGNQRFVAITESMKTFTSTDGVNWTPAVALTTATIRALTFGNNVFVGVLSSPNKVVKSSDGASWTELTSTGLAISLINSINYSFDTFVAVGGTGSIYTSVDGVAWAKRFSPPNNIDLRGIAYGKNRFVAVGAGGDIARSDEFPSTDLSALTSSAGPLTPGFSPLLTAYSAELARNVNVATVTPTSEDPQATIRVRFDSGSDVIVASGATSAVGQIPLGRFRSHTFYITVTARNNATKVYTLQVNKAPPIPRWLSWFWPFRWPA